MLRDHVENLTPVFHITARHVTGFVCVGVFVRACLFELKPLNQRALKNYELCKGYSCTDHFRLIRSRFFTCLKCSQIPE
jgi:hypothetical protein